MSLAPTTPRPTRLFLDAGVIIDGCFNRWGASKGVLVLTTLRSHYTVVLAEAVEREVQRAVARRTSGMETAAAAPILRDVAGWFERVRIERHSIPTEDVVREQAPIIMPVLKHLNDLAAVVTAIHAHPDWVLSTNTEHWNDRLAERTGLRVATPFAFLQQLLPPEPR